MIYLHEVAGTWTTRYRTVPQKIDRRQSISAVGGRLREESTVGDRLSEKKGRRRRGKEEKRKEKKKEYLVPMHRRRPHAILARMPSSPTRHPRSCAVAARKSPAPARHRRPQVAGVFSPMRGE
ncbi:hypothetical protein BHE74_00027107 [Ensete ventricosum]|nr:hypothetical protein BHE74_00027107 [Ensete ventricosum]